MFSKTKIVAIVAMSVSLLFFSACSKTDEISETENISGIDRVPVRDLAISDPEIKKEIEFMREKKIITEDLYKKWLKWPKGLILDESEILIDEQGTKRHDDYYRIQTSLSPEEFASGRMTDDVMVSRKQIQDAMNISTSGQSARMKRTTYMFGSTGGTIICRVFTASGNGYTAVSSDWKIALLSAAQHWNNQGLKVKFKVVVDATSTSIVGGYVNVYMADAYRPQTFATGWTPGTPGYFGEKLRINLIPGYVADANAKVKILVHELGHIVGFHHTDVVANNSDIFNTAISCNESNDANSFMFSTVDIHDVFQGFSACDKQNLQYYWGY